MKANIFSYLEKDSALKSSMRIILELLGSQMAFKVQIAKPNRATSGEISFMLITRHCFLPHSTQNFLLFIFLK